MEKKLEGQEDMAIKIYRRVARFMTHTQVQITPKLG